MVGRLVSTVFITPVFPVRYPDGNEPPDTAVGIVLFQCPVGKKRGRSMLSWYQRRQADADYTCEQQRNP